MVIAWGCLLAAAGVVAAGVAGVVVDQRRAEAAADLAALAGAEASVAGGDACAAAAEIAARNRASLTGCIVTGDEVVVVTELPARAPFGLEVRPTGRARAGPG